MDDPSPTAPAPEPSGPRRPSVWRTGLAGLMAAALALAVGELVAGLSSRLTSPVISVGNRVVDAVPRQLKDFAIETFGTNDKKALLIGIYTFAAVFGLVLGVLAGRKFVLGAIGIGLFGVVGIWAAGQEVGAPIWAGLPSVIGAAVGIAVLALLLATIPRAAHPHLVDRIAEEVQSSDATDGPAESPTDGPFARRGFLKMSGAVVVVGAVAATGGRWLQARYSAASSRLAVVLPKPKKPAPAVAKGAAIDLEGISPYPPSGAQKDESLTAEQQANLRAILAAARETDLAPVARAAVLAGAYSGQRTNFISKRSAES